MKAREHKFTQLTEASRRATSTYLEHLLMIGSLRSEPTTSMDN